MQRNHGSDEVPEEEGPQHRKPQEVKPGASWGRERVQWQSPGLWPHWLDGQSDTLSCCWVQVSAREGATC